MNFIQELLRTLRGNGKLLFSLVKDDFKLKFVGSRLGVVWGFIQPIVTIVIYWFVFQVAFRNGDKPDGTPYILWLVAGMVPWFFFSEAWSSATNCLHEYGFLVKKVLFKIELLPIVKILSAGIVHLFFLDLLFIMFATYGYEVDIYYIQLLYYMLCNVALIYAVSLLTSTIAAFIKDVNMIVSILLQVFFWMIPIVWDINELSSNKMLVNILRLNPLCYIMEGFRDSLINHQPFWDKPLYTCYFWTFIIIVLYLGIKIYKKVNAYFADVL